MVPYVHTGQTVSETMWMLKLVMVIARDATVRRLDYVVLKCMYRIIDAPDTKSS